MQASINDIPHEIWTSLGDEIILQKLRVTCRSLSTIPVLPITVVYRNQMTTTTCGQYSVTFCDCRYYLNVNNRGYTNTNIATGLQPGVVGTIMRDTAWVGPFVVYIDATFWPYSAAELRYFFHACGIPVPIMHTVTPICVSESNSEPPQMYPVSAEFGHKYILFNPIRMYVSMCPPETFANCGVSVSYLGYFYTSYTGAIILPLDSSHNLLEIRPDIRRIRQIFP